MLGFVQKLAVDVVVLVVEKVDVVVVVVANLDVVVGLFKMWMSDLL